MGKKKGSQAHTLYRKGLRAYKYGDTNTAIYFFKRALKYKPNNAKILKDLAIAYQGIGDLENYNKILRKSFENDPKPVLDEVVVHHNEYSTCFKAGKKSMREGKYDAAAQYFEMATSMNPMDYKAYLEAAKAYYKAGDVEMAYKNAATAYFWNDESEEAWNIVETIRKKLGLKGEEIDKFDAAMGNSIKGVEEWMNLGRTNLLLGDRKTAYDCFQKVLNTDPNNKYAIRYLSQLTRDSGDLEGVNL